MDMYYARKRDFLFIYMDVDLTRTRDAWDLVGCSFLLLARGCVPFYILHAMMAKITTIALVPGPQESAFISM